MVGNIHILADFLDGSGEDGLRNVLNSCYNACIQSCVGLAPRYRSRSGTELLECRLICLGIRDTDDQTLHIVNRVDFFVNSEYLAECKSIIVKNFDIGLSEDQICNLRTGLAGELIEAVLIIFIHIRKAKNTSLGNIVRIELSCDDAHVQGSVCQSLKVLSLCSECGAGINIDFHFSFGLLFYKTGKFKSCLVDGVLFSHLVAESECDLCLYIIII